MIVKANSKLVLRTADAAIYCGDNLEILRAEVEDESVDLVYLDPPFNSSQERVVVGGKSSERRAFDDRFASMDRYLDWIRPRLRESIRVLRPGGTAFLHCDWRSSHYLKVEMDCLLGSENLVNEIVWKRHTTHNDSRQGTRHFGRNADVILFYGKGERTVWNPVFIPYASDYVDRAYSHVEPETGRRYALGDLTGPGGTANGNPAFRFMGIERAWRYSRERMDELRKTGKIVVKKGSEVPRHKRYLDEMSGLQVQAIWDDLADLPDSERVHYPTQKPLDLLDRILRSSTNPGALVLDPFCGSGTALIAAARLGLKSVSIDESEVATNVTEERYHQWCIKEKAAPKASQAK